jgi:hypothetical protein
MDDERIDFSPLDPKRDEVRWGRIVTDLAAHAVTDRREHLSVQWQLACWARPVLAVAAGLCLLAWAGGWLGNGRASVDGETATALTVANWAANNQVPEPSALLQTLRGN